MKLSDLRVMVVEDSNFQRTFLVRILKKLGLEHIHEAEHGAQALEVLGHDDVDVILCDLDMPEMDGLEFLRKLGESKKACSVILNSALEPSLIGSVESMTREFGLKVLGAMEKPISVSRLQEMLELRIRQQAAPSGVYVEPPLTEIVQGLDSRQFAVHYQPKVSLADGALVGAEALLRWNHPQRGLLRSGSFMSSMERNNLVQRVTLLVLEEGLSQLRRWREHGLSLTLSVNLSPVFLAQADASSLLVREFEHMTAEPGWVTFEVSEESVVEPAGQLLENLARLRMKGFGLALDDYAARTSIMQLSRFPFTELKIDPSLLLEMHRDSTMVVLESSLALGRKLKLRTVAEGVEKSEDFDLLADQGCDQAQGNFIAKPMAAEEFLAWAVKQPRPSELLASAPAAPPPGGVAGPQVKAGDRLAHYTLDALIGGGGMGKVFRATDTRLLRQVAIKVLAGSSLTTVELERFVQEARAVARVQHPGIVTIYEIGLDPFHYIVMELINGSELEDLLEKQGALPWEQARDLCVQILEALQAVHSKGVVHRDLKPANIMLDPEGRVRIMDFGLAKFLGEVGGLTKDGEVWGTPRYMSPEHIDPTFGPIDHQSDVFAAGTILYQMLTGKLPIESTIISKVLHELFYKQPVPPHHVNPNVPEALSEVCMQALEKDKACRPANAGDMARALRAV